MRDPPSVRRDTDQRHGATRILAALSRALVSGPTSSPTIACRQGGYNKAVIEAGRRSRPLTALAACAGTVRLPAPNTAQARFEPQSGAVQVMVSDIAPAAAAALLDPHGERYSAAAVTVLSGPQIAYNPPPTLGIGIGGFGFSGCCSGFGSGVGLGVPVGRPTPAAVSDQYISSVVIPVPAAYAQHWSGYHVQVQVGSRALLLEFRHSPLA